MKKKTPAVMCVICNTEFQNNNRGARKNMNTCFDCRYWK